MVISIMISKLKKIIIRFLCSQGWHCKEGHKVLRTSIMRPVYGPNFSIVYWKHEGGPWDIQIGPLKELECKGCGHKYHTLML